MKNILQFLKFGLVGISNTLISEFIYVLVVLLHGNYMIASFLGFMISVLNAYYWSNKYVFVQEEGEHRVWWKVLAKTYIAYLGGYILSSILLIFWIDVIELSRYMSGLANLFAQSGYEKLDAEFLGDIIAAGINLIITVPLNYVVNKKWAYKKGK